MFTTRRSLPVLSALAVLVSGVGITIGSPAAGAATPEPLNVAIELHVEQKNSMQLANQAHAIETIASASAAASIPISFGIADEYFRTSGSYDVTAQDATLDVIESYGIHQIDAHLDWTYSATDLATQLDGVAAAFATTTGTDGTARDLPTTTSGTCTEDDTDWVDDALGHGVVLAAGAVVDCERSLDPSLQESGYYKPNCKPMTCHGAAPAADPTARLTPWTTSTTSTWMVDDPTGDLTVMSSWVDLPLTCLAEGATTNCPTAGLTNFQLATTAAADARAMVTSLRAALAACGTVDLGDTYYVTWSMNSIPADAYITSFFSTLRSELSRTGVASLVEFVTLEGAALEA